jgi:hypothetical protein
MRVLSLYKPKNPQSGPPSAEHMAKMGAFAEEMTRKGHLIAAGGFLTATPMTIGLAGGQFSFAEGGATIPQGVHGFGIIQAESREEMIAVVKQFLEIAGDGECFLSPLMEGPPR